MLSIWWGSFSSSAGNMWAPLYLSIVCFLHLKLKINKSTDDFLPTVCFIQAVIFSIWFQVVCLHVSGLMFKHGCCLCRQCTVKAASALHDKLFRRLLRSPMQFFDTTPLGRILTRFSRDMDEGEAWFILTVNHSPKSTLSRRSHPGWQDVVPRHSVIWHAIFSLASGSLLSTSLVSLLDVLICG